jgi:hypothetical protein
MIVYFVYWMPVPAIDSYSCHRVLVGCKFVVVVIVVVFQEVENERKIERNNVVVMKVWLVGCDRITRRRDESSHSREDESVSPSVFHRKG